ncbi:MAG: hypothetical protein LBD70_01820, partial [Bifidobacteriaceae bacterium]|nr:hypothetical protein [Bifidobacteriaceae bacterium]
MRSRTGGIPHTATRAAFLLGGIGTGNVSIGARGELRDWELENGPDKGRVNPNSFFAIHVEPSRDHAGDVRPATKVLEARISGRHDWDAGYSFGELAGLPRLAGATLYGEYPVADVDFSDDELPVEVSLRAFTPLVPLDADASGIPAAVLRYRVTNPQECALRVTVAGSLSHVAGCENGIYAIRAHQTIRWRDEQGVRGLDFGTRLDPDDFGYGTMSLTTTDSAVTAKPQWVAGLWPDGAQLFWTDFKSDGLLEPEARRTLEDHPGQLASDAAGQTPLTEEEVLDRLPKLRTGSLGIVHEIAPGESSDFEFVLSWNFPNRRRGWLSTMIGDDPNRDAVTRNHYAVLWPDAWSAACHLHKRLPALEAATNAFVEALYGGTLDPIIAEAVGANIAAVRSTTCFVVETPNPLLGEGPVFAAWEGSFDHKGSCEGTCTHVWSYAQTVAWLFPQLERSARRVEYLLETDSNGAQRFRTNRVFGGPAWSMPMGPAVDGQLATLVRLHREWRFCGDDEFLRELWPSAARAMEYAIRQWDRDDDGLLDGELHNTYDIEFHGIEPLANGLFLAALKAGARMAAQLGENQRAADWLRRAERAAAAMEATLWNGEYYHQVIANVDDYRYQYGQGVLSDQLLGQFHAYVNGLGELLPREHVRTALSAIVKHNFRPDLRDHESTQRTYALNDEGGLLLASWPNRGRPIIPFVYSDEVWTGIEHQVAASLAYAGLPDEALLIERSLRARYSGTTRNPWNEIECGNHYARSLASWALLLAFSGADWDAPTRTLAFNPVSNGQFLFTTSAAWGTVEIDDHSVKLTVLGGKLDLDR